MGTLTQDDARKAIQRLWVAGTLGAFLSALVGSVAINIHQASWSPDWQYTLDLFVRYLYLIWLLVYFFISEFRIEESNHKYDVSYNLIQSFVSLAALVALDFVAPGQGLPLKTSYRGAIIVANLAIIVIAALALCFFKDQPDQKDRQKVNNLRYAGVGLAVLSILVAWMSPFSAVLTLLVVSCFALGLIAVLCAYVRIRWPDA